jgi:hypothetical protein
MAGTPRWRTLRAIGATLQHSRAARIALGTVVSVFALGSVYELQRHPAEQSSTPNASAAQALAAFAKAHKVTVGYASYWAAIEIDWADHLRFDVYPIHDCSPTGTTLCRDGIGEISSWYRPRHDIRSLVVVDPGFPLLSSLDPSLGAPLITTTIDGMTVRVYSYDIASKLISS